MRTSAKSMLLNSRYIPVKWLHVASMIICIGPVIGMSITGWPHFEWLKTLYAQAAADCLIFSDNDAVNECVAYFRISARSVWLALEVVTIQFGLGVLYGLYGRLYPRHSQTRRQIQDLTAGFLVTAFLLATVALLALVLTARYGLFMPVEFKPIRG